MTVATSSLPPTEALMAKEGTVNDSAPSLMGCDACLNTTFPSSPSSTSCFWTENRDKFPLPFQVIPSHITSMEECAKHHITLLLEKEESELTGDDEDALDDGFVLCDLNVVKNKLLAWRHLFHRIQPFFALKCNPDPMVAAVLGFLQAGFDCASVPEIELAISSSAGKLDRVVYANPQRAERDLETALKKGVRALTFDGPEELFKVKNAYLKMRAAAVASNTSENNLPDVPVMILRLLVPDQHSTVPLGEKFGTPPSQIERLVKQAIELELPILGVSFHCGSGNHDPQAYQVAVELAAEAINIVNRVQRDEHGLKHLYCNLLDIGGGYPGSDGFGADNGRFVGTTTTPSTETVAHLDEHKEAEQHVETAEHIAKVVMPVMDNLFPILTANTSDDDSDKKQVHLIAEPGRYFVEAAFCLVSRIYQLRVEQRPDGEHFHYYIAQGVRGLFKDCVLCGESFIPVPVVLREDFEENDDNNKALCTIHGPSGEDYDIICQNILLPKLQVGDWFLFDRMGAYTLSIAARSGRPTIRYVAGGHQLS